MAWDMRSLQKLQRDTGFKADFLEKTYHITRILAAVSGADGLRDCLALKGGTALNFIFLDVPRLSIDLDFNFVGALEKEDMLAQRPDVVKRLRELAMSMGYQFIKKPSSYIMDRFLLRYSRLNGLPDSVRIEINFLERVPFLRIERESFHDLFDSKRFEVNTYAVEEIAAMKTKAMVERLYARDIFDVHQMAKLRLENVTLRKLMILYMLMAGKSPEIDALVSRVQKYDDGDILTAMRPFLREGEEERLNPGKIKAEVARFYRNVFVLEDDDKRFLKAIESGKLDLKLLFAGKNFDPRASKHPALLRALDNKAKRGRNNGD